MKRVEVVLEAMSVASLVLCLAALVLILAAHLKMQSLELEHQSLRQEMHNACLLSDAEFSATERRVMAFNYHIEDWKRLNDRNAVLDFIIPDSVESLWGISIPTEIQCAVMQRAQHHAGLTGPNSQ